MCGRYVIAPPDEEILKMIREINRTKLAEIFREANQPPVTGAGEILPASVVPVIATSRTGERRFFPMKWGFTGKTLLMNARVETAAVKPTFRDAWKSHRCIVPASYYFEWEHLIGNNGKTKTGDKYAIQPQGSSMTWLCGLYRFENDLPFFVILTREPGEQIRFIHDRMPLILPEHLVNAWIDPDVDPQELVKEAVTDVISEKAG